MKKLICILAFVFALALPAVSMAESVTIATDAPTAGTWTDETAFDGYFWAKVYGATWAGTVVLQVSIDDGTTWQTFDSWTANDIAIKFSPPGAIWRIGMLDAGYTSGSVTATISAQ
jgi:hypothetical protein